MKNIGNIQCYKEFIDKYKMFYLYPHSMNDL